MKLGLLENSLFLNFFHLKFLFVCLFIRFQNIVRKKPSISTILGFSASVKIRLIWD